MPNGEESDEIPAELADLVPEYRPFRAGCAEIVRILFFHHQLRLNIFFTKRNLVSPPFLGKVHRKSI